MFAVKLLALSIILLGVCVTSFGQSTPNVQRATAAARQLWSADESDRAAAKQTLLTLGEASLPPLRSLLKDVVEDPTTTRFALGEEKEAAELQRRVESFSPGDSPAEMVENLSRLRQACINGRLRKDAASLLGQLNPQEVVSTLATGLLSDYDAGGEWAVAALVDAGAPAVPAIIELIGTARERARCYYANEIRATTEDLGWKVEWKAAVFQMRAVEALGKIGDVRAISALISLDASDNVGLRRSVDEAIQKIVDSSSESSR